MMKELEERYYISPQLKEKLLEVQDFDKRIGQAQRLKNTGKSIPELLKEHEQAMKVLESNEAKVALPDTDRKAIDAPKPKSRFHDDASIVTDPRFK